MKISVEKLVANRANAQKSTGPQSSEGKLRSAKNAVKHGLNTSSNTLANPSSDSLLQSAHLILEFQAYTQELISSGYSDAQSQELVAALIASRQVIEAKHDAYTDRLNDERLANMTPEAAAEFVREMEGFQSTVTKYERRAVIGLMYGGAQKDNDLVGLLFEKFEAHRKLIRYEQRAFNQLRKKSQVKK